MPKSRFVNSLFLKKSLHTKEKRLMVIFAHPDDETISTGGILYKAFEENIKTFILCLSEGKNGIFNSKYEHNIANVRRSEFIKATKDILHAERYFLEKFPDGDFRNNVFDLQKKVFQIIKSVDPQVIITHDPSGITNHPDHITVSKIVFDLVRKKLKNNVDLYFSTLGKMELEYRKSLNSKIDFTNLAQSTHQINIESAIDKKVELYENYQSQNIGKRFNMPLKLWFMFNHYESLHKVDFFNSYSFENYPFFFFIKNGTKIIKKIYK